MAASSLVERMHRVRELAQSRGAETVAPSAPEKLTTAKVIQLPLWPEPARGVPNVALRSALFGVVKKGTRHYLKKEKIYSQADIELFYTGEQLDQGDLDLHETVTHVCRVQALGSECRVTAYQLLKLMGKGDTGPNRDTLDARLTRMKATAICVSVGRYSYEGSLIDEVWRDKNTKEYVIVLNPKLAALFESDQFTLVDWNVRRALSGKQLAQWLHGYYASHAKPFPVSVSMLHDLCGSDIVRIDHFREKLKTALDAVVAISEAKGYTFSYTIVDDLVHVEKTPSKAQKKHLNKKISSKM